MDDVARQGTSLLETALEELPVRSLQKRVMKAVSS